MKAGGTEQLQKKKEQGTLKKQAASIELEDTGDEIINVRLGNKK